MPVYNKLARDLILQIIEKSGSKFTTCTLHSSEYLTEIKKKLEEEVQEYQETTNALEELADILELIHAALPIHEATTFKDLETIRIAKKEKRGEFEKGIYLIEVKEE